MDASRTLKISCQYVATLWKQTCAARPYGPPHRDLAFDENSLSKSRIGIATPNEYSLCFSMSFNNWFSRVWRSGLRPAFIRSSLAGEFDHMEKGQLPAPDQLSPGMIERFPFVWLLPEARDGQDPGFTVSATFITICGKDHGLMSSTSL